MIYKEPKRIYEVRPGVYTIGRPGDYAPRIKRVPNPAGRGRPSFRRIRGGEVPAGLPAVTRLPVTLLRYLQEADKVPEA